MKILIVGATGAIGGAFLKHTVKRDEVNEVVALTRKPLPETHEKVQNIIIPDFGNLESVYEETWQRIRDADALIWAMGTYNLNEDVNMRYPLAFQEAFAKRLAASRGGRKQKFRFILLSGAFVEPDQSRTLLFLPQQRKVKGVTESKTVEFGKSHGDMWEAFAVRPGGILFGNTFANKVVEFLFGKSLAIRSEELGAYVADLAVNGSRDGTIIRNLDMVERGRKLLSDAI